MREAFLGNTAAARQGAAAALQLSKARDVEYGAAFALALSGEFSKSETLADDLIARFPEDTFVRFTYLPTLRALFALNRSEPTSALDMLQVAAPHDLAIPGSWSGFFGNLYPSYVRGTAFLFTHQAAEAAAEFQKILDQRATVFSDPVAAAARLQLARALAMAGESAGAKKAYRDFLTVWKDADSDIPILKQARLEYAKLL